jgi:hypothetical protein
MLKRAFIGAFAPFARAPAPAAPGAGFAAPAAFEWRKAVTAPARLGRVVARALAPGPRPPDLGRIVSELAALNDHTLADIGVHRSQIPVLAHAVAERPSVDPRTIES